MATKSRLNRALEKKTKKNLYLSVIGIIVVLFLLIKFGLPALINFSLFLANGKDQQLAAKSGQNSKILLSPILVQSFTATNSATIVVTGTAVAKEKIELFLNNNLQDITDTNTDGTFSFQVEIKPGNNTILTKAKLDNKESNPSNTLSITYNNKPPTLSVDSPSDGQTFSGGSQQNISVKGKTDSSDIKVTVNGFWAIENADGSYSYTFHLQGGDNQIKVIATDQAGNQTEKDLTVHFNP